MTEKTKKSKKKLHYFTLSPEFEGKFEDYIQTNFIDKSKLIESLLIDFITKNNQSK